MELMDPATKNGGKFWARWEDGIVTTHVMHKDFRNGATLDLAHAYRQLAVSEKNTRRTRSKECRKGGKTYYYVSRAFLFGAPANVLNFNRAARALNFLVHKCTGASVTNFFDDFVLIAPAPWQRSCTKEW